jgi:hypothetical protein
MTELWSYRDTTTTVQTTDLVGNLAACSPRVSAIATMRLEPGLAVPPSTHRAEASMERARGLAAVGMDEGWRGVRQARRAAKTLAI